MKPERLFLTYFGTPRSTLQPYKVKAFHTDVYTGMTLVRYSSLILQPFLLTSITAINNNHQ